MCKILEFDPEKTNSSQCSGNEEGYTYFAKAILDDICEGEDNPRDIRIQICDRFGKYHDIESVSLLDGVMTLQST